MKFIESKPKSLIYTMLIYLFCLFEMGVLSAYRFVEIGTAADKYSNGMSINKVANLAQVGENVGWNYVTWSVLLILGIWGFCMLLGYNRNPGGLIGIGIMNVLPLLGLFTNFTFWMGYGYGIYYPAMSLFGLTFCETNAQQKLNAVIFMVIVMVVAVVCWIIGFRIRKSYAAKYEFDDL